MRSEGYGSCLSVYVNSRTTCYGAAYERYKQLQRNKCSKNNVANFAETSEFEREIPLRGPPNPVISSAHAYTSVEEVYSIASCLAHSPLLGSYTLVTDLGRAVSGRPLYLVCVRCEVQPPRDAEGCVVATTRPSTSHCRQRQRFPTRKTATPVSSTS